MRQNVLIILLLCAACSTKKGNVVSQRYIHKYGIETTKEQWIANNREGKVAKTLDTGVKIVASYRKGVLHGEKTESFPFSDDIAKKSIYSGGTLVSCRYIDKAGFPITESRYLDKNTKTLLYWDNRGAPIRKETFSANKLTNGIYYNPLGDVESTVQQGNGTRVKRDRLGAILEVDSLQQGKMVKHITYFPNGRVKTEEYFNSAEQLHGEQYAYYPNGDKSKIALWDSGLLHGKTTTFKDNKVTSVTHYDKGEKIGKALTFDAKGALLSKVNYLNDKKHGKAKFYGTYPKTEWYFLGRLVTKEEFDSFSYRKSIENITDE